MKKKKSTTLKRTTKRNVLRQETTLCRRSNALFSLAKWEFPFEGSQIYEKVQGPPSAPDGTHFCDFSPRES